MKQTTEHQRDVLLSAFGGKARRTQLRGALGHAISFGTWYSLCIDNGLSDRAAADLMTAMVLNTAGVTHA
jgi:hypothetical protein